MRDPIDWKQVWEEKAAKSASDFEFDRGTSPREEEIDKLAANELLEFIGPNSSDIIFDAGCGTGVNIFLLNDKVKGIIGMDYSSGALARCEQRIQSNKIKNVELLHGEITELPLSNDSVDKVICLSVLQYLNDEAVKTAFKEFGRILKQDGVLILHVKNLASLYLSTLIVAKKLKAALGGSPKIEYFRSFRWYMNQLEAQGFEIVTYNSFNLFMFELMPKRLLYFFQKMELNHRENSFFSNNLMRSLGSDLKIKAKIVKE